MKRRTGKGSSERGFSLLEVMFATMIMLIVSIGLLSLFTLAIARNSEYGDQGTKITEFAGDKMEQLMALTFSDTTSDVTQTPSCITSNGCVPSGINAKGLQAGGSITAGDFTHAGYYDFIDPKVASGSPTTVKPTYGYARQWMIVDANPGSATNSLKTIYVRVSMIGSASKLTRTTTLISQKADF